MERRAARRRPRRDSERARHRACGHGSVTASAASSSQSSPCGSPPGSTARVLLDPALHIDPAVARERADLTRVDVSFASPDEAIDARLTDGSLFTTPREMLAEEAREHLRRGGDGALSLAVSPGRRDRCVERDGGTGAPVAALPDAGRRRGERSWVPLACAEARHDHAAIVPGGHSVLWDDFDATADAIVRFLAANSGAASAGVTGPALRHLAAAADTESMLGSRTFLMLGITIAAVAVGAGGCCCPARATARRQSQTRHPGWIAQTTRAFFSSAEASLEAQHTATGSYAGALAATTADTGAGGSRPRTASSSPRGPLLQHELGPGGTGQPGACP